MRFVCRGDFKPRTFTPRKQTPDRRTYVAISPNLPREALTRAVRGPVRHLGLLAVQCVFGASGLYLLERIGGIAMKAAKWVFALCGLSLLILVSQARATTSVSVDGSWWSTNTNIAKFYVVQGIVAGEMRAGYFLAVGRCTRIADDI